MPRRKRPKSPSSARPTSESDASPSHASAARSASSTDDAIGRFASALRASDERERAQREHERVEREHAEALAEARLDLERAIDVVRTARRTGTGGPEADTTWRIAKARVIELETGAPPEWAGTADVTEPASEPGVDTAADESGDVPGDA